MKSKMIRSAAAAAVFISALALIFIFTDREAKRRGAEEAASRAEAVYTVAEYQGKVAVFRKNEKIPAEIFDTYVAVLPEHDRRLLKEGITASSPEELQSIIEDYTS